MTQLYVLWIDYSWVDDDRLSEWRGWFDILLAGYVKEEMF